MAASNPWRQGPWPLLLGLVLLALATGGGWWLGSRQRPTSALAGRTAQLEGEIRRLRSRQERREASPAEQQRLLELLVTLGRRPEAIALLEPMADREPDRWSLRLMLAELRRSGGDRRGAERELRMILNRSSDQPEALQLMTLLQLEQGRGSVAEAQVRAAYQKAIRPPARPQAVALGLLLAELQQKRGQTGAAEATYRQMAVDFPEDQRPLLAMALLQNARGDRKGAQESLAMARERGDEPGSSRVLDRLAASWGMAPLRDSDDRRAGTPLPGPSPESPAPSIPAR